MLSEDKIKIPTSQLHYIQKERGWASKAEARGQQGRSWSGHGLGLPWLPLPLLELWIPEVVGEGEEAEKRGQRHWVSHRSMRGPRHHSFPRPRPRPLGHVAFRRLPRSLQHLSPALERSWSLQAAGVCSGSSNGFPSLGRRTVVVNSHPARSGAPLPHICR